jgi:hypothetical protein
MNFLKYFLRNLCGKSANLVILRLKYKWFYDVVVTIATKVNACGTSLPITVTMATKQPHFASSKKMQKIRIFIIYYLL